MKANHSINSLSLIVFAAMLSLPLAAMALAGPAQSTASVQATQNDHATLQLGTVEVKGQRQIIKTLQAIKVALRQPESSDPKLQNAVVCRITSDVGSHAEQLLVCATNRTLSERRAATQSAFLVGCQGPSSTCSIEQAANSGALTSVMMSFKDRIMTVRVDAGALRTLLRKIPDPVPEASSTRH